MPLPRECDHCKKRFQPVTRHTNLCPDCLYRTRNENFKKMLEFRKFKYRRI